MLIQERNDTALRLRELYGAIRLERFMPAVELRKAAPYYGYVDVRIAGGRPFVMFSNNDDFVSEHYFWKGADAYEPMTLRLWTALAKQAAYVLDVGSYTGVFALSAASVNRRARVCAFEALDRVYFRLVLNREVNGLGNLRTFHVAVAEAAGEMEFCVYSGESVLVTASSLVEKGGVRPVAERKRVRTVSLDAMRGDAFPSIELMKIDAEGAEHLVLRGCRESLRATRPDIICELLPGAHTEEIETLLRELGYRFFKIDDQGMSLQPVQALTAAGGMGDLNTLITTKTEDVLARLLEAPTG